MTGSERVPDPSRPDPDALLARVQAESVQETRGRLKIFFGFAPGVGKTFRMLHVARELVFGQHFQASDVLVGIVETHGRPETQAMLRGLEILPRKNVEYRGRTLQEFDLDAALARKPAVVVLDELAHTNAPGSRHPKRWQDAEELLAAGVSVFTTLNVQHVESLNDVIAQITGVRVRETVPDAVLERADSIELIDITPDELLERLAAGKVYLPAQARRATENFFQRGNLLALRELALRRTAEHVDEDVRAYRRNHGVSTTWPAAERIMVWLDRGEQADRLLRAAARMAAGLRCTWVAAYRDVEPATGGGRVEELESALRGAESLGGYVVRVPGTDPIGSLLRCARQQNVTRLIVGKPPTRSTRGWFGASQLDEIVRGSGEIEVLVITTEAGQDRRTPLSSSTQRPSARDYLGATAVVGIAVGSSALLRESLDLPDLDVLFVLAVMVVAVLFGRGPSR